MLFGALFVLPIVSAWAQDSTDSVVVIPPWPLYVVAIIVGIVVSVLLSRVARRTDKVDIPLAYRRDVEGELQRSIEDQLSSGLVSGANRSEVARKISRAVSEKVGQKVVEATRGMKDKYESVIAQKDKEQEIVHLKYKNIVSEKNQTEAVMKSLAEGLVVVNGKGEVVMMNPAAEKLLGVDKEDKVGKTLTEGMKGNELVSMVQGAAGGKEKVVELDSPQQETRKVIRSSSAVVESEDGQTVGMVSVLTDVTKQRELEEMKSQFVSTVTHELRTPIVATQKALAVILDKVAGPLTTDQARFLEIAQRNLGRLNYLINDILDFSKLEAGKMNMEMVSASVAQVVREASEPFKSWADSKGIHLEQKIEDNLPQGMMDANRIIQVLNNLIGNALKFTPKGGVITVEAKRGGGASEVEVSVEDTGSGIPEADLGRVFERFIQLSERRATDISGTGLGLSIAKEVVERHGGRIWVENVKGKGAKFSFVLPVSKGT